VRVDIGRDEGAVKLIRLQLILIDDATHLQIGSEVDPPDHSQIVSPNLKQKDVEETGKMLPQLHLDCLHFRLIILAHATQLSKRDVRVKALAQKSGSLRHLLHFVLGKDRMVDQEKLLVF